MRMLERFRSRATKAIALTLCGLALLTVAGCGSPGTDMPALKLTAPPDDR
ncbi:MAG: hypothetical protein ACR2J1_11040 [Methyloceanibacter sp.]